MRENFTEIEFSSDLPNLTGSLLFENRNPPAVGEKFVVFFLDDELFAVAAAQVSEVVRPPDVTALPRVPEWLLGIAHLRGEIITVVDLSKLLNKPHSRTSAKPKLIVLHSPDARARIAFLVDKLSEMTTLPADEIEFCRATSPFVFGRAAHQTNSLNLLDARALVSSLRLHG